MTLGELIARDGQACVWCGRELWLSDLNIEHLLPVSRGGRGHPENLLVACRRCNRRRRSRGVAAYARTRLAVGPLPRFDLLVRGLERLSDSQSRSHATYGRRQLALLQRLAADQAAHRCTSTTTRAPSGGRSR